jgi:hypothetical protein
MDEKKEGTCHDCNSYGTLIYTNACADSEVGYDKCCYKYTCVNNCVWKCSLCFIQNKHNNMLYCCFLEHIFFNMYKYHVKKYILNIKKILPFYNKIQNLIIDFLDINPIVRKDYITKYNIPDNCIQNKPIEALICKKCVKTYIKNPKTVEPIKWWGMSIQEWLYRYG